MNLSVKCPECKKQNKTPHSMSNRVDYAKKYGDNFTLKCPDCNTASEYHVDDIRALDYSFGEIIKNRLLVFILVFVIMFVIGLFVISVGGAIALSIIISSISILLSKKNDSKKNLEFNKHKLKGRVSGVSFR